MLYMGPKSSKCFNAAPRADFPEPYRPVATARENPSLALIENSMINPVSVTNEAFAYCQKAYAGVSDDKIGMKVKVGQTERNLLGLMWYNNSHTNEHYGNLVTYLRVRGIVPPSSER